MYTETFENTVCLKAQGTLYDPVNRLALNPGLKIKHSMRTKTRVQATYSHSAPVFVKMLRDSSFFARGPHLYDKLSPELRDLEKVATPT